MYVIFFFQFWKWYILNINWRVAEFIFLSFYMNIDRILVKLVYFSNYFESALNFYLIQVKPNQLQVYCIKISMICILCVFLSVFTFITKHILFNVIFFAAPRAVEKSKRRNQAVSSISSHSIHLTAYGVKKLSWLCEGATQGHNGLEAQLKACLDWIEFGTKAALLIMILFTIGVFCCHDVYIQ